MGKTKKKQQSTVKKQKKNKFKEIFFHSHLENECYLLSATIIKCPMIQGNIRNKNKTGIKQSKISDSHKFCVLRKHLEGNKILSVVHCLFVSCTSKENMGDSLEEPFLFQRRSLQKYNNNINNYYCTLYVVKSFPINVAFVSFLSPCFQKQNEDLCFPLQYI